jgi:predicted polyphosphate/ATP-dependent NAD kinase
MTHAYDLIDADVPPARAAMLAAEALDNESRSTDSAIVDIDAKPCKRHMRFVSITTNDTMSNVLEYLIQHHDFKFAPQQPENGIELFALMK